MIGKNSNKNQDNRPPSCSCPGWRTVNRRITNRRTAELQKGIRSEQTNRRTAELQKGIRSEQTNRRTAE